MSTDLTEADLAALVECATQYGLAQALHAAHRAGLAACRARAIEEAAQVIERKGGANFGRYAAAIRALLNAPAACSTEP